MKDLHHGDNLPIMQGMAAGSVDLIYADPPFGTGKDWGAFVDKRTGDEYLAWIKPRLNEMKRLLALTGSIYLHCDPTMSHYLKVLMDEVFGRAQFRNEIVWCYKSGGRAKVHFPKKHDVILWYSKSRKDYVFNYDAVSLPRDTSTMHEPVILDDSGRKYQRNFKNGKEYRYYLDKGVLPDDWWADIQAENPASKKRTGYPTQKPLSLLNRIILASSNPGDVVLDPFCGSGTALVSAERAGRQWIGIDQSAEAIRIASERTGAQVAATAAAGAAALTA